MTRPTVHEGDNDNRDVRLLQQLLRDMNYAVGNIDGDFGPKTRDAVIAYQTDHAIGDTPGECGPNTWAALEAQFGNLEGLRAEESVHEYVEETYGTAHSSMDPDEQLAALASSANQQLANAGVPYVPIAFGDAGSNWAEFDWRTWTIAVNRAMYDQAQEAGNAAENMDTVYHESRHGEQWWTIGRLLAGLYDMDGAAINAHTGLKLEIANEAAQDPILQSNTQTDAAIHWYEQTFGASPVPAGMDRPREADAGGAGGSVKRAVAQYVSSGTATGRCILRKGSDEASEIRYLQELLIWRGFAPGAVDGDFGDDTERAVKAFQAANGLDDDGVVGRLTWEALLP
ncbi:MAG: peptidoglycan-binding protein [Actinomycetota bacterium]|nr:peptidoglycan-binding protein [Actinomycetota bacterium]